MWAPLIRHLICPIHERLLGRSTFAQLRDLEDTQWHSPDDIRALQKRRLGVLLRHAAANIPFYQAVFLRAGIDVDGTDPLDVLAQLPLMDKPDIRRHMDRLLWRDAPGGLHARSTGGSSGSPLRFYLDRRRQGCDQACRIRAHRWFGADLGRPELYLWGSPIEHSSTDRVKRLRDRLFNHHLLDAFAMSRERMDSYLDLFESVRPVCLFGYPSSIALLVEHARRRGWRLDTRRLEAVFVTGEVCYDHDREAIASYFGVPVADSYGCREAGLIAHECPSGSAHLMAESVIVEIIRDAAPVPVGETGEIVVTHLDAYAMPFIRYRTGDIGRLRSGRCACGRGLPLMDVVEGRSTDFLHLPDGTTKHALSIIYPLRELPGVDRFRVTQHEDYAVTIEVVADDRSDRITQEAIRGKVRPVLGEKLGLNISLVREIPVTDSGKYRYVVSRVKPAGVRGGHERVRV